MVGLKILADENIPDLEAACSEWGALRRLPGRAIDHAALGDSELLFVRSVTAVDHKLLQGSAVKFVASATIGVDHVDTQYLRSQGIGFAHAPGCNANAVVDYVMSIVLERYTDDEISKRHFGIVGYGNVGRRLARCLHHFNLSYSVYDPLIEQPPENRVDTLDKILCCDIVSLHVPLTHSGKHATEALLNSARLKRLKPGALLINSSRGPVVDNAALKRRLPLEPSLEAALDVWQDEPAIDTELAEKLLVATPHIAGYSQQGKLRGSVQILRAAAAYFSLPLTAVPALPNSVTLDNISSMRDYRYQLSRCYSASIDSLRFCQAVSSGRSIEATFDNFRKNYPLRNEINYGE